MKFLKKFIHLTPALCAISSLHAGIVTTFDNQGDEEVSYYQDGISSTWTNGQLISLYDGKTSMIFHFNHSQQVFTKVSLSELPGKIKAALDQQAEMMKASPFFQLMQEQQKKEAASHKYETKKAESKEIAGFKADAYHILKDGKMLKEIWVSKDLSNKIQKEFPADKFEKVAQEGEKMIRDLMGEDPESDQQSKIESYGTIVYEMEKDPYFGETEVEMELKGAIETKIEQKYFKTPEGFQEIDFSTFQQLDEEDEDDYNEGESEEDEGNDWS